MEQDMYEHIFGANYNNTCKTYYEKYRII